MCDRDLFGRYQFMWLNEQNVHKSVESRVESASLLSVTAALFGLWLNCFDVVICVSHMHICQQVFCKHTDSSHSTILTKRIEAAALGHKM